MSLATEPRSHQAREGWPPRRGVAEPEKLGRGPSRVDGCLVESVPHLSAAVTPWQATQCFGGSVPTIGGSVATS
jgi:hypothetical protein